MKAAFYLLLFILSILYCYGQERVSDIDNRKPSSYMLLINQEGQERVLTVYLDGQYDIRKINGDGSDSIAYIGDLGFDIFETWKVYYHSHHIIYHDTKNLHIHNISKNLTHTLQPPEAYAFGRINKSLIDSNSFFIPLTETLWNIQAKYYHVDFKANYTKIETKHRFISRSKDYVIATNTDGIRSYFIYDIQQDAIRDFNVNSNRVVNYKLKEEGIYSVVDGSLVLTDYDTFNDQVIMNVPIGYDGFVDIDILGDTMVLVNRINANQRFVIINKATKTTVFDTTFLDNYYLRHKTLVGDKLIISTSIKDSFPVAYQFLIVDLHTSALVTVDCDCDILPNTLHHYDNKLYYYGNFGLNAINLQTLSLDHLTREENYRYLNYSASLEGGNLLLNLAHSDYVLNPGIAIYNKDIGELQRLEPLKSSKGGLLNYAKVYAYNEVILVNNTDIYLNKDGVNTKLNTNDRIYKANSLKYFREIDKTYVILQNGFIFDLIQIDSNGVTELISFNGMLGFTDYLYFDGSLLFLSRENLFHYVLDSGTLELLDGSIFRAKVINGQLIGWNARDLFIYGNLYDAPVSFKFDNNIRSVNQFKDQILITDGDLFRIQNGKLESVPRDFELKDSDFIFSENKLDSSHLFNIVIDYRSNIGIYNGDSLINYGSIPFVHDSKVAGNSFLTSIDAEGYIYDYQSRNLHPLLPFLKDQEYIDLIIDQSDTIVISVDLSDRFYISFTKFTDSFTKATVTHELKEENIRSNIYSYLYNEELLVKTGCHLYSIGEEITEIVDNLNPNQISEPVILDSFIYYIGWSSLKGNQLYRYSMHYVDTMDIEPPVIIDSISYIVYPNPAQDQLYLSKGIRYVGDIEYSIINSQGRLIRSDWIEDVGESINIADLCSGMYYIKTTIGKDSFICPFVKIE